MERMGLVSQVESELERMISLELLPADGSLPSEQKLARCFGVSRGTLREALRRLSARGLVVQRSGRKTRAVALDEAVTLENLSVALDGDARTRPERWRLLEGYFALKRDMTVELLAACCEGACAEDLERLEQACFALGDAARWDEGGRGWVQQEFELLRLAARAADRPGHLLLIHSLERAFWGMARWVLPHLASEAVQPWALCAMYALAEKNPQALRRELPSLLQAGDERLLRGLAPASQAPEPCESHHTVAEPHPDGPSAPGAPRGDLPDAAAPNLSDSRTGSRQPPPTEGSLPEPSSANPCHEPVRATLEADSPPGPEENGRAHMHPPSGLGRDRAPVAVPQRTDESRVPGEQALPHPQPLEGAEPSPGPRIPSSGVAPG